MVAPFVELLIVTVLPMFTVPPVGFSVGVTTLFGAPPPDEHAVNPLLQVSPVGQLFQLLQPLAVHDFTWNPAPLF
jgi:hypothetical protein